MPSMTKKDFVALAAAIREGVSSLRPDDGQEGSGTAALIWVAQAIAAHCAQANGNFKRDRFLEACGAQEIAAHVTGSSKCGTQQRNDTPTITHAELVEALADSRAVQGKIIEQMEVAQAEAYEAGYERATQDAHLAQGR